MSDQQKTQSWQPIESLPEGEQVLLYFPHGENGVGGIEAAMVFRVGDEWHYWSHGGPNNGQDYEPPRDDRGDIERPTHWMPLPEPPK